MRYFTLLLVSVLVLMTACSGTPALSDADQRRVLIYGASGRIGGHIVDEALLRGYDVTGVTRNAERLQNRLDRINVVVSDILDTDATARLIREYDAVIVSIGGKPVDKVPANYIAATAAESLVTAVRSLDRPGPRIIFVGNLYTLDFEAGKTPLEMDRVPLSHRNYAMFYGHQLALDTFRNSNDINWTVASPPNGLRLKGRTGKVRWGEDTLLRDADGTPSTISPEDFSYAVLEELEAGRYIRQRFTVAQ